MWRFQNTFCGGGSNLVTYYLEAYFKKRELICFLISLEIQNMTYFQVGRGGKALNLCPSAILRNLNCPFKDPNFLFQSYWSIEPTNVDIKRGKHTRSIFNNARQGISKMDLLSNFSIIPILTLFSTTFLHEFPSKHQHYLFRGQTISISEKTDSGEIRPCQLI